MIALEKCESCIDILKLIKITSVMRNWSDLNIEQRLVTADRLLKKRAITYEETNFAMELRTDLCNDPYFCEAAGLNYNNLTKNDSRIIKAAIAHYFATN